MAARTFSKTWDTRALIEPGESASSPRTALIVLNSPLPPQPLFRKLWQTASLRFCADGGANRLYDRFVRGKDRADESDWDQAIDGNEELWLPDLILGDLDSLREDVRKYYESKVRARGTLLSCWRARLAAHQGVSAQGVTVEQDPDEFSTDLGKNVTRLSAIEAGDIPPPANSHARWRQEQPLQDGATRQQYHLVLIGGLSGRLDQTVHTLHAMTLLAEKEQRERVWAIGKESVALLLTKGVHQLHIDLKWFGKTCGILPVGSTEAHVITTGLEWDLGPTAYMFPTSLSTAVSTSNHLIQEEVKIETDVPVVWTMEVRGGSE